MTELNKVSLPNAVGDKVINRLIEKYFPLCIEGAITRILNGSPGERIAFMQLAMPYLDNDEVFLFPFEIDQTLLARYNDYLKEFKLNSILLMTGSLLVEMGLENLPDKLPTFGSIHKER